MLFKEFLLNCIQHQIVIKENSGQKGKSLRTISILVGHHILTTFSLESEIYSFKTNFVVIDFCLILSVDVVFMNFSFQLSFRYDRNYL